MTFAIRSLTQRFQRLQTRLTVLYAALFGLVLVGVCGLTWAGVSAQARSTVQTNLAVAGGNYDQLWRERADRARSGAELLAKDYGFRAALASHDAPTIASAVENLKARLHLDLAFAVDAGGGLIGSNGAPAIARAAAQELARTSDAQGVLMADSQPYDVVAAPIFAPELQGWVVFATRLDAANLASLGVLSSIPLQAEVVHGSQDHWWSHDGPVALRLPDGPKSPGYMQGPRGIELAVLRTLAVPPGAEPAALLLHYPQAAALAAYRGLFEMIFALGLVGMALVVAGSWVLARSITRPIAALALAARRLREGHVAHVDAHGAGGGEVGALASGFNAMVDAVSEREATIRRSALSDQDTGMPNRRALEQALAERLDTDPAAVWVAATFSIDQFARMRGVLGFELALEMIGRLGARLGALEPNWTIGRTAGDTLTAVFATESIEAAAARVEAARERLEAAVPVGGHLVDVRMTTGLGFGLPAHLIRDAELALDAARAQGLKRAVFDDRARIRAADSLGLMPELRRAMAGEGLTLAHQPKWDVRREGVTGVESLIRWTHPDRGQIPPDAFIGLAESTGDIRALTDWVVMQALAEQAELAAAGSRLCFSINLSGRLVGDRDYTRWLLDTLANAAGPVCMEITETAVIGDPQAALATFAALNEAGVHVSIDDYGSGLSSLAYLKQIAADELKLDRSLVVDVAKSARDALLIRSTVDLAHGLGMKVVAEGVEHATDMALLAGLGCDLIQGWHVARPMPVLQLADFLDALPATHDAAAAQPVLRRVGAC